jgi:hypothetical protein
MKFSLRSLMLVAIIAPPLLAWGWCAIDVALTPEMVYPGGHEVRDTSWLEATREVQRFGRIHGEATP